MASNELHSTDANGKKQDADLHAYILERGKTDIKKARVLAQEMGLTKEQAQTLIPD